VINGFLYFGSVYLYSFFTSSSNKESEHEGSGMVYVVLSILMRALYSLWIFFVYIVAMTLSTFWVQDIFDELIKIKLVRFFKKDGEPNLQESECQRIQA